jgi:hypothetical protein
MRDQGQGADAQGVILGEGAEVEAVRSATPTVYVPRRFRIGGIDGIATGSAIVGTPQGDGMVAIEVELDPEVEPTPEAWGEWVAAAAARHSAEAGQRVGGDSGRTVSEAAVVAVGRFVEDHVVIDDTGSGAAISRWIQAGRADYVVEAPFPHES